MKIYYQFLKLLFAKKLAYRFDFFASMLSVTLWSFTVPLFMILVYTNGAQYPGWTFNELFVFLGIYNLLTGIGRTLFFNMFFNVINRVQKGELELILVKPVDEIYFLISESFDYSGFGDIFVGAGLFTYGYIQVSPEINFLSLLVNSIFAIAFFFSCILIITTLAIKFVKVDRLIELFETVMQFSEYPKNMYPLFLMSSFTFFVPFFIFSYYPASAVLGFETQNMHWIFLSVLVWFIGSILFWKFTIKRYMGAGG